MFGAQRGSTGRTGPDMEITDRRPQWLHAAPAIIL